MEFLGLLNVPLILLFSVIVPLWLIFHYLTKWKQMKRAGAGKGETVVDRKELLRLREIAVMLDERIEALETILDGDSPRGKNK